eukprot:465579-Prorocentrum_minimum.AAC.1
MPSERSVSAAGGKVSQRGSHTCNTSSRFTFASSFASEEYAAATASATFAPTAATPRPRPGTAHSAAKAAYMPCR